MVMAEVDRRANLRHLEAVRAKLANYPPGTVTLEEVAALVALIDAAHAAWREWQNAAEKLADDAVSLANEIGPLE